MDDLADRLRDAGTALLDLRGPLVAGEPWPLSAVFGTEPEADWGPREVLAHVNEMLPYWVAQLSVVLAADPAGPPPPFGRVATDAERIGRIAADRDLAIDPLLDEIAIGLNAATTFIGAMSDADGERIGLHPARGEITVRAGLEPFLVGHVEGHVEQLREILGRPRAAGG